MTTEIPKIYFNIYVAGVLRERPDYEAINTDLLYFCLLMKANLLAKEVFTLRLNGAEKEMIVATAKLLQTTRKFMLDFFDIPDPNWSLIQNEELDDLEKLRRLPDPSKPPSVSVSSSASVETAQTPVPADLPSSESSEEKNCDDPSHQLRSVEELLLDC